MTQTVIIYNIGAIMNRFFPLIAILLLAALPALPAAATTPSTPVGVVVYPEAPLPRAAEFSVKVNGIDIAVYNAGTFRCAPFAFSGAITVAVTYHPGAIRSFQINPLAKGIAATQNGNTLTFQLTQQASIRHANRRFRQPFFGCPVA